MSDLMKNVHQVTMAGNVRKLCEISGMLQTLSCMQGCTVTPEMSSLLIDACEMIDGVIGNLMKEEQG